ncbi:MAG TPA: type II secretion system protein GspG [Chthoniobacteraceae bacterium]|nr:type II secretion system protein GspG [Chthoniobacteraceae bacterium]
MTRRFPKIPVVLVALFATGWVNGYQTSASPKADHAANSRTLLATLQKALGLYYDLNGTYPTTNQGLPALATRPDVAPKPKQWRKLLEFELTKDSWGRPLVYRFPGEKYPRSYDLYSAGEDGKPGTEDDIWPK